MKPKLSNDDIEEIIHYLEDLLATFNKRKKHPKDCQDCKGCRRLVRKLKKIKKNETPYKKGKSWLEVVNKSEMF